MTSGKKLFVAGCCAVVVHSGGHLCSSRRICGDAARGRQREGRSFLPLRYSVLQIMWKGVVARL